MWYVYILRCADGTLYTGSTTDLQRRLRTHNSGKGAKYTRSRRPVEFAYWEQAADKSAAFRREAAIKALTRAEKLRLIQHKEDKTMREMRRKDRQVTTEEAWGIVDKCSYGVLTMTAEDGTPYGVPVNYGRSGDALYFHSALEGKKADSLRKNGAACMVCVSESRVVEEKYTTAYASAMVFGTVTEITAPEEKLSALRALCEATAPTNMAMFDGYCTPAMLERTAVWKLTAEHITGKKRTL
ncbi:MAG: pyridoxamine 5'-phosphate oxidase family protein [Oscillibacter sp.]|nr:pyridoxamine 5'-phosphate oxidase family protein [Oscillibacter sp.]